ncbi:unnamed protein product, partial [Allacma fusca]
MMAVPASAFDDPIRSFTTAFHSKILTGCSSVDLTLQGNFTSASNSKIIHSARTIFPGQTILQMFKQNPDHSLTSPILKHFFGCYVIVAKINNVDNFSLESFEIFNNNVLSTYCIFIFPKQPNGEIVSEDQITTFANFVRRIPKPIFLTVSEFGLKGFVSRGANTKQVKNIYETNYRGLTSNNDLSNLLESKPDFQQEPITVLVCAVCVPKETEDGKTEPPDPIVNTLYDFVTFVNASLVLEPVFGDVKASHFENGEWDEWVAP